MTALTTTDPAQLVQITDTHLHGREGRTLLKMDTRKSLEQVLQLVSRNEGRPDFVVVTGDVAQDGSTAAYRQFLQQIATLDAPFRWIPGNHDSPATMREIDATACGTELRINNWFILFLDSSVEGKIHGELSASQLEVLRQRLAEIEADSLVDYCLICLHHNPVEGSAAWMQDIGLHRSREFFSVIKNYPKVRCLIYGHIHQELDFSNQGIRCLCTPSTCIQFKPDVSDFTLDPLNPGYRSVRLYADGRIDSRVHRIEGFAWVADFESPGY